MRFALLAVAFLAFVNGSTLPAADDLRPFHVPDREFQPVEPAPWVRDGAVKVFVGLDDLQTIDEVAALGATIVHSGGPWPYYPLRRDDPKSGLPADEAAKVRAGVARAKSHGMRVLIGIMPLAPVEIVKQHPDWVLHATDEAKHREVLTQVDLTHPDHWFKRATALNSLSHALGVFRVGFEEHLPLNLITEHDLRPEVVAKYKVLVLANAACLSDEQVQTVRDYVANGGGLVATCETSMFDEIGRPRADFALGDLFGVSYLGRPKAPDVRPELDVNFSVVVDDAYWAQRNGVAALRWGAGDLLTGELVDDPRLVKVVRNVQARCIRWWWWS